MRIRNAAARLCIVALMAFGVLSAASGQTPSKQAHPASALINLMRKHHAAVQAQSTGLKPLRIVSKGRATERTSRSAKGLHQAATPEDRDDFFEARQFFIRDRLDRRGKFVPTNRDRALVHAGKMAIDLGGKATPAVKAQAGLATGSWFNIGPSSQIPASTLFNGPSPVSGRVNAVQYNPSNPSIVYAGTAGGGLFKSYDGGQNWTPLTDAWPYLSISAIAIDRTAPSTIYIGTGDFQGLMPYSFGIMKSIDGGSTWTNYGKSLFGGLAISRILIDPDNHNLITITTGRGYDLNAGSWSDWLHGGSLDGLQGGIYQSTDAGKTWTRRNPPYADWCGLDISVPDGLGNRTYWAAGSYPNNSYQGTVWYSNDRGMTWSAAANVNGNRIAMDVACSKIDHGTVYLLAPDSNPGGFPPYDGTNTSTVYKTTDGGLNWYDYGGGFPDSASLPGFDGYFYNWSQGFYDYYIRTSSATIGGVAQDVVYVGLISLVVSPDGANTWTDVGQCFSYDAASGTSSARLHVDQHAWAANPLDPNTVLLGNDGGVFEMVFDPSSMSVVFSPLNHNGLISTQFYTMAVNPTSNSDVIAGAQDNGSPMFTGNKGNWNTITAGDGGFCAVDPHNPSIQYVTANGVNVARTTDNWSSGAMISDASIFPGSEIRSFIPPLAVGNTGELYYATDHLWRWTSAAGWKGDLGGQLLSASGGVRSIAICPGSNKLYTGSQDGQLWMTPDLGSTWQRIDGGSTSLPMAPMVALSVSPAANNDIVVGLAGYGTSHLWRCSRTDLGASKTWVDVSGSGINGLPDAPVSSVARDPYSPLTTWYVGTDVGVFVTRNAGNTWANMSGAAGLPNVQVTDLKVSGGYLWAATYGRGIWRIKLEDSSLVAVGSVSAPSSIIGSATGYATLNLNMPAAFGGAVVKLASDSPNLKIQSTALIPNGATSVNVSFTTSGVSTVTPAHITATLNGNSTATVNLQPGALSSLTGPAQVVGQVPFLATVSLAGPSTVDASVTILASSYDFSTPGGVTVPAGASSTQFSVRPMIVTTPTVKTITVRYLSVQTTASFTVLPPSISTVVMSPTSVKRGNATICTVTLNAPAPAGGWQLRVTSSNPNAASVPTTITVPAAYRVVSFPVSTAAAATAQSITVTVTPVTWGGGAFASFTIY